jgi:hypothetical protein
MNGKIWFAVAVILVSTLGLGSGVAGIIDISMQASAQNMSQMGNMTGGNMTAGGGGNMTGGMSNSTLAP